MEHNLKLTDLEKQKLKIALDILKRVNDDLDEDDHLGFEIEDYTLLNEIAEVSSNIGYACDAWNEYRR